MSIERLYVRYDTWKWSLSYECKMKDGVKSPESCCLFKCWMIVCQKGRDNSRSTNHKPGQNQTPRLTCPALSFSFLSRSQGASIALIGQYFSIDLYGSKRGKSEHKMTTTSTRRISKVYCIDDTHASRVLFQMQYRGFCAQLYLYTERAGISPVDRLTQATRGRRGFVKLSDPIRTSFHRMPLRTF